MNPNFFTQVVSAGMAAMMSTPGKVLSVKAVSGTISVAMDGKAASPIYSGTVLYGPFSYLNFFNPSGADAVVSFFVGDDVVPFQPADNGQSNARSLLFGNLGIRTLSPANVAFPGSPAYDANGYLQITNAMRLLVAGNRNGLRRQTAFISVSPNSPAAVTVQAPDTNVGAEFSAMTLAAGSQVPLTFDSDFFLSGTGGTAWVTVGQVFLQGA